MLQDHGFHCVKHQDALTGECSKKEDVEAEEGKKKDRGRKIQDQDVKMLVVYEGMNPFWESNKSNH